MHKGYKAQLAILLLTAACGGCFCKETPHELKLADCNTNVLTFKITWPAGTSFNIVLGVPFSQTNALAFQGDLTFRQGTGTIIRIPVDSNATPCNWLNNRPSGPHLAGFILTWPRSNASIQLDNLFAVGRTYEVDAIFSNPPPQTSSLWLCWLGKATIF